MLNLQQIREEIQEIQSNIPVALSTKLHPCVPNVTAQIVMHVSIPCQSTKGTFNSITERAERKLLPATVLQQKMYAAAFFYPSSTPLQRMRVRVPVCVYDGKHTSKSHLLMAVKSPG